MTTTYYNNQRKIGLYNFMTGAEIRGNFELQIPDKYKAKRWLGSVYGWLVFIEKESYLL